MKTKTFLLSALSILLFVSAYSQSKGLPDQIKDCRTFMSTKGIELKLDTIRKNPTGLQTLAIVLNKDTEYSFILSSNCFGLKLTLYKDTMLCGTNIKGKDYLQGFNFVCKKSGVHVLKYDFSGIANINFKGAMMYYFVSKLSNSDGSAKEPKKNVFPILMKE